MKNLKRLWRTVLVSIILAALCGSFGFAGDEVPVQAAPLMQVATTPHIVISEFRFLGPQGGNDEFIELYNATGSSVDISGWKIMGSNNAGSTSARATIPASTALVAGQYYLVANTASNGYSGTSTPDLSYTSSITDDGGVALTLANGTTIIDAAGLSSGSAYKEGTPLIPLSGTANQSYERRVAGSAGNCSDTDNNVADFLLNPSSSNPQNSGSQPFPCLVVTNVTSNTADGTYTSPTTIDVRITFSGIVSVTGTPRLQLETGATDKYADYQSGDGSNTLVFSYSATAGDFSNDLDYVSVSALSLNGGSITGPIGNANLALPTPGSAGSLGANKNIVINIDNGTPPSVVSIRRQNPLTTPTTATSLTFRVSFNENVVNVDSADFVVTGTTAPITNVTAVSGSVYDVTVSGGNLATIDGVIGLNISAAASIQDQTGNALPLPPVEPPAADDETYNVNHSQPTVTLNLASGQASSTGVTPVNFTVVFSEPIVLSTFTASDITQNGTARFITWSITNPLGDRKNFNLSATSIAQNGTVTPSVNAGQVTDDVGNPNLASSLPNPTVDFNDNVRPGVTVNQANGQLDPATALPIRFTVVFSEPINTTVFTPSDITQNGTASNITWTITDTGDHKTFTIAATIVTGGGTLIPSIRANQVTDLVGNSNTASTSTDNTVTYNSAPGLGIVISEFRTRGPNGANDEFIEIYNPTGSPVDISGWKINASGETGSVETKATVPASTLLRSGQYYLIANSNASGGYTNTDAPANLTYGTSIADTGGIALLRSDNTIIDQVGMSPGSAYKEGSTLAPLTENINRSYERKLGGSSDSCVDTNNNASDFQNKAPSDPHNYSFPLSLCGTLKPSPATTVTTITGDSPDPSVVNGTFTVSVTVTGGSSTPTGIVNISGANTNCTITLSSSGSGSCSTVNFTTSGAKTLTATYLGDNTHAASSDTEPHQVSSVSTFKTPTPIFVAPAPPPPLIAINEFVPRPGHDWNDDGIVNVGDEYIELLNHGTVDVNLSGYRLDDEVNIGSSPYSLPSKVLKPGERFVFYGSETGLLLSDGGDGVRLLKPNGQLMDAYNYSVAGYPDQSYCRLPDNGGADDWNKNCYPTPGFQNSLSGDFAVSPNVSEEPLCPIADTLPDDFVLAECDPFGQHIWSPEYWDKTGWYKNKILPIVNGKWDLFAD
jgi:hypothetical protein